MSAPPPSEALIKVFVYGTLKRDQPNHHFFWKPDSGYARFLCTGKTVAKFPMMVATRHNLPFLLNKPGFGHNILGEVFEIDEQMLISLDEFEEYPLLYDRQLRDIELENGLELN